ncbi:MAG TPA: hypothetical protein PKD12_02995 [Nitrospira sp.]|nr:hypothetical protein [Nitrospira sp.]
METYLECAKLLDELLAGVRAVRITVRGFMPLSVEEIGVSQDGQRLVSLCHYGEQNGDLMRDPDIVFLFHNGPGGAAAEPVSYRNDYLGLSQEVYRYDEAGRRTHVVPSLKQELKEFAESWFANLKDQGFFASTAVREILSP